MANTELKWHRVGEDVIQGHLAIHSQHILSEVLSISFIAVFCCVLGSISCTRLEVFKYPMLNVSTPINNMMDAKMGCTFKPMKLQLNQTCMNQIWLHQTHLHQTHRHQLHLIQVHLKSMSHWDKFIIDRPLGLDKSITESLNENKCPWIWHLQK